MRSLLPVALVAALSGMATGCTSTGQKFTERAYSAPDAKGDQYIETETIIKNRTIAPPFGSKADSTHSFTTEVKEDGSYNIVMGSAGKIEGGEIATFVQALTLVMAEATKLIAVLEGVPAPLLEPLTLPGVHP